MSRARRKQASYALTGTAYMEALSAAPLLYREEPVTTIGMIAQANNATLQAARDKWKKARKLKDEQGRPFFREGEHYHTIRGAELEALKASIGADSGLNGADQHQSNLYGIRAKSNAALTLFTRKGALKLTARFDSAQANDVQDELVSYYLAGPQTLSPEAVQSVTQQVLSALAPMLQAMQQANEALGKDLHVARAERNLALAQRDRADAYAQSSMSAHASALAKAGHAKRREREVRAAEKRLSEWVPMKPMGGDYTIQGQWLLAFGENGPRLVQVEPELAGAS